MAPRTATKALALRTVLHKANLKDPTAPRVLLMGPRNLPMDPRNLPMDHQVPRMVLLLVDSISCHIRTGTVTKPPETLSLEGSTTSLDSTTCSNLFIYIQYTTF